MTVLLVDDEKTVRDGLKVLIDWRAYGFDTFLEGEDGSDGLAKMIGLKPELTLLDIRMPKMNGLEVAEQAREAGYEGSIIMLSGYSDFKYAQSAIRFGVDAYLLKSIDENELAEAVGKVRGEIERVTETAARSKLYLKMERDKLLCGILLGSQWTHADLSAHHIRLDSDVYQVAVIDAKQPCEAYGDGFTDFLTECFPEFPAEYAQINGRFALLLKGADAIARLPAVIEALRKQTGDNIFAGIGRTVNVPGDIRLSYSDANRIVEYKFYCHKADFAVCWKEDANWPAAQRAWEEIDIQEYAGNIYAHQQAGDAAKIFEALDKLEQKLIAERMQPEKAKGMLSGLCIQVLGMQRILHGHGQRESLADTEIVDAIYGKEYLEDIIRFLKEEFKRLCLSPDGAGSKDITARIFNYIDMNSDRNIKLESIASLFGYNCTYLGKLCKKVKGMSFNDYLDQVRIKKAKTLLSGSDLKVYEICEKAGYGSLNYFYKKFKKYTGVSPSDYRRRNEDESKAGNTK